MILPLLRHQWRRHRAALLAMTAGAALFEFLLTRIAPTGTGSWISRALEAVPPQLMALAGSDMVSNLSPDRFLAIGYGHPFVVLLLSAWVVRATSGALAGELGMGTIDLIATRPVPRWHFVTAGAAATLGGLLLILFAAWGGTALGSALRDLGVARELAGVAAGAGLLFAAWGGVGLLVSATRRDSGSAIGWTAGLIAAGFVLDYLARLWDPISALRPLSLFRWFEPQSILSAGVSAATVAVLAGVAIAGFAGALIAFGARDL